MAQLARAFGEVLVIGGVLSLGEELGATYDDVFVAGVFEGNVNVARIRIDSLGPGVPAD